VIPALSNSRLLRLLGCSLALLAAQCKQNELSDERGAAPPPVQSSRPDTCASGGGEIKDAVSKPLVPRISGDYCIDPHGEARAYGAQAGSALDTVCRELFNGECEVYKSFGLERVVTLRYVDGKGSPGSVNLNLSRFSTPAGAYAFFTKRVVADSDPFTSAPEALDAGAVGALGSGIAYVWKAEHVAELSYNNEIETPDQLRASGRRVLVPIAQGVGKLLPGSAELPAPAARLPRDNQVSLGISYGLDRLLGIDGLGPGAVGFYRADSTRWRMLVASRPDADAARDVLRTLQKLGGKELKNQTPTVISLERPGKVEWLFFAQGADVMGVGDEEFAPETARLDDKNKLERLRALGSSVSGETKVDK
jgi:hypothetical protein